jgi:hypothetical protein
MSTVLLNEYKGLHSPCKLGHISCHISSERGYDRGELGSLLLCHGKCDTSALICGKDVLMAFCLGECGPSACFLSKIVLAALYLGEVELRGHCGGLTATAFCSRSRYSEGYPGF